MTVDAPTPWRTLRCRLPLLMSGLIALGLTVALGLTSRQMARALDRTGSERAAAAADQLGTLLTQSIARGYGEGRRIAGDPALREFLAAPGGDSAPARALLAPLAVAAQPAVELRAADGSLALSVKAPNGKSIALEASVPLQPGLSPFFAAGRTVFYGLVVPIADAPPGAPSGAAAPTARTLGYLVVRRVLSAAQTTDTLQRLVGSGALVAVGARGAGVWTDLTTAIAAPPMDMTRTGALIYQRDGQWRIGALATVAGTPWMTWIEFPRDAIQAPGYAMRRQLIAIGLMVIACSAILVGIISARAMRPLRELGEATAAIANGDYARRARTDGRDEVAWLARTFNVMVERVETSHRELEAQVQERTAELDRFFSLSLDLLCIADTDGRFRRVNPAWQEVLGWTAEELTGRPYVDFVHPDDRVATTTEASDLAHGATTMRFENRYRAKDGTYRWLSWNSAPDTARGRIYGAARDITPDKATAQAIERHVTDLKNTNDELEAFSYSVSHDLRAPLRHVAGFAALLTQSAGDRLTDQDRRYLKTITDAAARMGQLIDDLLSFSRMGRTALQRQRVRLDEVVVDARREVAAAAPATLRWQVHALPEVEADRAMLTLAFVNLLGNAVKYSADRPNPSIEIGVNGSINGETVVYVKDNGVGFDMQYAHKLFGVFQRLHSSDDFEGTGIGLANVRRIVHRHGGRVWAESAAGAGATFFVALPTPGEKHT